jgi:CDP-paratose 2-epimerase
VKKAVLVTGSAGFIGKHTVRGLKEAGHRVFGIDRRDDGGGKMDLSSRRLELVADLHRPDFVIHLAASCSTPGSLAHPLDTFEDTVVTAANVTEFARQWMVPILMVSSVKARDGQTPYGAAKRMVELWSEDYQDSFGLPTIIVRPGTVYGPEQEGSTESGWIAWFLQAKRQGIKVTINGDGSQVRDLLYVSDLVSLFLKMVEDPSRYVGRTWDVGGGVKNAVTVEQMAQYLGLSYDFGLFRHGDAASYIGINDAPGWEPEVEWRNGIGRLL